MIQVKTMNSSWIFLPLLIASFGAFLLGRGNYLDINDSVMYVGILIFCTGLFIATIMLSLLDIQLTGCIRTRSKINEC